MTTKVRAAFRPQTEAGPQREQTADEPRPRAWADLPTRVDADRPVLPAALPALTHNLPQHARLCRVQRGLLWTAEPDGLRSSRIATRVPVEFRRVEKRHLPLLLAAAAQMDSIAPDALLRRYALERQCFAGWVDGAIATYGWLTRGPEWVGEFERQLNVAHDEAYIWDCATLPMYRRRHLFSALVAAVAEQLWHEDLRRLWIIAAVTTPSMNHDIGEAGFRPALALTFVRFFNRHILLARPAQESPARAVAQGLRLLKQQGEHEYGGLLAGTSGIFRP